MTEQHQIAPPPELVREWTSLANEEEGHDVWDSFARWAARWGADVELEACCEWLDNTDVDDSQEAAKDLRAARRPKPPSLKEQALAALHGIHDQGPSPEQVKTIRIALETLND